MPSTSIRACVFALLNPDDHDSPASNSANFLLIGLILANLVAVSLQTVDSINQRYATQFLQFEIFSVVVFSIEFLLRVWTAVEHEKFAKRRSFLFSFDAIIDVISILPLYLSLLFGVDLRALIALRLLRLLKLVRYFAPLLMLAQVIKAEARAFVAAIFILLILVFVAASGIYFFERQAQPDEFGSIPSAMWWATVTLTTLGYGDIVPITIGGKIFAALMTILSVGTVALPAGMLASRFSEELHKRKQDYSDLVMELAADGTLDDRDQLSLDRARTSLCISATDAELIQSEIEKTAPCPHCKGSGKIAPPIP